MSLSKKICQTDFQDRFVALRSYMSDYCYDRKLPMNGTFELTPRCTLDCKMCYIHLQPSQMKQPELTTEQWLSLCQDAVENGIVYATLTGGEAMMHPGFKKIYEYLHSNGVFVIIMTNGTLIDEEMADWLSDHYPHFVQLSVYGYDPDSYERVTGSGSSFFTVDKAISLLKERGIALQLAVTVSKYNYGNIEKTLQYCAKKEPTRYISASFMSECREDTGRFLNDYMLTVDEETNAYRRYLEFMGKVITPRSDKEVEEFLQSRTVRPPVKIGPSCAAGNFKYWIRWDGIMQPCFGLQCTQSKPLEDGFIEAWQKIVEGVNIVTTPIECRTCDYHGLCRHCPGFHYDEVKCYGKASPRICALGKRFVKEGLI